MESEQEQEQKQLFLRKEILEQKYDPQKFIDFLVAKKGETAADINNWTLEELKSVVIEFKSLNKDNTSSNTNKINNSNNNSQEKIKNKNNNILYNDELNNEWLFITPESEIPSNLTTSNISSENNKIIEIDCLEPDQSPLSNYDKLHIKISSPKKEYDTTGLKGFFMKTVYYTFLLENEELKISKRRRYTDFEWLRKTFCRLFPGHYITPLPLKSMNVNKVNKIEKYTRDLQRFIDGIIEDKLFKNSSLLYLFLSSEKESDLIDLMNKFDEVKKPRELKYYYSRDGKIVLDYKILNLNNKNKLIKIKEEIDKHNLMFSNLNKLFKNLCEQIKQVSELMLQISNVFKDLNNLENKLENTNNNKFYHNLELFFRERSNLEIKKMDNISIELKEYFKFTNLKYISSLKELYDQFDYENDLYYKASQNLKKRKELLYANGPIEKWELSENEKNIDIKNKDEVIKKILPKDTAVVKEIKKYLVYYSTRLDKEYLRLKELIKKENDITFNNLRNKSIDNCEKLNNFFKLIIDSK
jgi:hypothetical protein